MNYAHTADSFHVPGIRQKPVRKPRWWQFWKSPEPPKPKPANANYAQGDIPPFLRRHPPRSADVQEREDWNYNGRKTETRQAPVPQPVEEPKPLPIPKLDAIGELKRQLRTCTYAEFMKAAEGLGFKPKQAWDWAVS